MTHNNDPLGQALLDYTNNTLHSPELMVTADVLEDDVIPVAHFFRTFATMPTIEQIAINHCIGSILDIGAAAGCHSLALQQRHHQVLAVEQSPGAIQVLQHHNIPCVQQDFYDFALEKRRKRFDTLLCLMNGLGLAQSLHNLPLFFATLAKLSHDNSQILIDSSDFAEDASDFAHINYQMHYASTQGKISSAPFPWLFLPFSCLNTAALEAGFKAKLLHQEFDGSYLAQLVKG